MMANCLMESGGSVHLAANNNVISGLLENGQMPEDFTRCVKNGGRVRTVTGSADKKFGVPAGYYRRICFDKDGTAHLGELKKKEAKKEGS